LKRLRALLDTAGERGARTLMMVRVHSRAAGSQTEFVTEMTASTLVTFGIYQV
jgi:hypothetical protein